MSTSLANSTFPTASPHYNATPRSFTGSTDVPGPFRDVESWVVVWLDRVLPPIIFIVGLISNALVVLVMRSRYFRSSSTAFYMIVNSITESFCLLFALPPHFLYVNFPSYSELIRGRHWLCSIFNLVGWGTSDLGIYFTVAMTIERAIGVWKPLKMSIYCTKRRAKFIVAGLTVFEMAKLLPLVIFSRVVESDSKSSLCDIDRTDSKFVYFYDAVWSWCHVAVLSLCYILAVAGNCIIIFYVRKSLTKQNPLHSGLVVVEKRKESRKAVQNKQISVMLVIASLTLVVCTLPFAIVNLLSSKSHVFINFDDGKNLAFTLSFYLLYINRCLSLFLYCVSGSQFRKAMKQVICCRRIGNTSHRPRCTCGVHGRRGKEASLTGGQLSVDSSDSLTSSRVTRGLSLYPDLCSSINLTTLVNIPCVLAQSFSTRKRRRSTSFKRRSTDIVRKDVFKSNSQRQRSTEIVGIDVFTSNSKRCIQNKEDIGGIHSNEETQICSGYQDSKTLNISAASHQKTCVDDASEIQMVLDNSSKNHTANDIENDKVDNSSMTFAGDRAPEKYTVTLYLCDLFYV